MSNPPIVREVRFTSEDPARYDYVKESDVNSVRRRKENPNESLKYAEVRINMFSDYSAELVKLILPTLVKERQPRTLEFINYRDWQKSATEKALLRGVMLRGKGGDLLLFVYGVGLIDSGRGSLPEYIFDTLGISKEDQKGIEDAAWPKLDYSVVVNLL